MHDSKTAEPNLPRACDLCGGAQEIVRTYKHLWLVCEICGAVTRRLRERLPLDAFRFLNPLFSPWARSRLWRAQDIRSPGGSSITYDLYGRIARQGVAGTKWEGQLDRMERDFRRAGLRMDGPVLDISGGPGFLVAELQKKGIEATVTEYNEESAKGMREALGIDAVAFDYNSQRIDEVFARPFRTVLIRWNLNFCRDLERFTRQLARIVDDGGIVYADFVQPTLGVCLRWQHDDYIFERLWHPDTVRGFFERAGFEWVARTEFEPYLAWSGYIAGFRPPPHLAGTKNCPRPRLGASALYAAAMLPFLLRGWFRGRALNRSLCQRYIGFLFRKRSGRSVPSR